MIETVSKENVRTTRTRKRNGVRYKDAYWEAVKPLVPFLKEMIKEQDTVIIKVDTMKKELGPYFVDKDWTTVFTGLKYVLWHYDMVIKSGTHKDGGKLFLIRNKINGDVLTDTLSALDKNDNSITGNTIEMPKQ